MIAKLINGTPFKCPDSGRDGKGIFHTNLPLFYERHLDDAAVDDYYMVIFTEKPGANYKSSWAKQTYLERMCIVQIWTPYTPDPEPMEVDIEKLRSDVDYIAMMTDIDLEGIL